MSITSIARTGMKAANTAIIHTADNIANSQTIGFKSNDVTFANIMDNNGVTTYVGNDIDIKGSIEYTGGEFDIAMQDNNHFLIVKNKINGEVCNVVTGSFETNKEANQLEYLDKYLLLGVAYNKDGSLPSYDINTLTPIVINKGILSDAQATTNIAESFNLNSNLLATGQGSFVMKPSAANASTTKSLDDALIDSGSLKSGEGFSIQVQESKNGQILTNSVKCIFSGALQATLNSNDNFPGNNNPTDSIDIIYNGLSASIKTQNIIGQNNDEALEKIAEQLSKIGLNATSTLDTTAGKSILTITPPRNPTDSLTISGVLATSLGIVANIQPIQQGSVRFSSMSDLKNSLTGYFSEIDSDSKSDSLIFIAHPNTNVSVKNLQANDSLNALGMYSGSILGQGYDPYDSSNNMASGNIKPDITHTVNLIDSKGGQHLATVALKKVTDGWMQEVYIADVSNILDGRPDGLLQVTKFHFDTKGEFKAAASVMPTITTSQVPNPFASISKAVGSGTTVTVNNVTFTQGTDFDSIVDLATAINADSTINENVSATIFKDSSGAYRMKVLSLTNTPATVVSTITSLTTNGDIQQIPSVRDKLTINFNANANIDPIQVNFEYSDIKESSHKEMVSNVKSDGVAPSIMMRTAIDAFGNLKGVFADGSQKNLYKIPTATYANIMGLEQIGDNALQATAKSGQMKIVDSGEIKAGSIEGSNVDQARELTNLITNKQLYNINTKSWQTGNELLTYLLSAANT